MGGVAWPAPALARVRPGDVLKGFVELLSLLVPHGDKLRTLTRALRRATVDLVEPDDFHGRFNRRRVALAAPDWAEGDIYNEDLNAAWFLRGTLNTNRGRGEIPRTKDVNAVEAAQLVKSYRRSGGEIFFAPCSRRMAAARSGHAFEEACLGYGLIPEDCELLYTRFVNNTLAPRRPERAFHVFHRPDEMNYFLLPQV